MLAKKGHDFLFILLIVGNRYAPAHLHCMQTSQDSEFCDPVQDKTVCRVYGILTLHPQNIMVRVWLTQNLFFTERPSLSLTTLDAVCSVRSLSQTQVE